MKVAIISDTHFGDPQCALIVYKKNTKGRKFDDFKASAGVGNDFLVLLGDVFDFSIATYDEAYGEAKTFFQLVKDEGIAKKIIYVPGNHDFDFWHSVEYEVNIINQIKSGAPPRQFRWSVPGILDLRTNQGNFQLHGVAKQANGEYGGLFLDNITGGAGPFPFYVAYPNLYIVTDNEVVLCTHGHYLEGYWAFMGELAIGVADDEMPNDVMGQLNIKEMVAVNNPLNQLACSGIGQSGPLREVALRVQKEAKAGNVSTIEKFIEKGDKYADSLTDYGWYDPREWAADAINGVVKKVALWGLDKMKNVKTARYTESFLKDKSVQARFNRYFNSSADEWDNIKKTLPAPLPNIESVVFGHTHEPIGPGEQPLKMKFLRQTVTISNTGGWLDEPVNGGFAFCGAEVFTCATGGKLSSKSVR